MKNLDLLPNVIFVGAEKSGSATIHRVHQSIQISLQPWKQNFLLYKKE